MAVRRSNATGASTPEPVGTAVADSSDPQLDVRTGCWISSPRQPRPA